SARARWRPCSLGTRAGSRETARSRTPRKRDPHPRTHAATWRREERPPKRGTMPRSFLRRTGETNRRGAERTPPGWRPLGARRSPARCARRATRDDRGACRLLLEERGRGQRGRKTRQRHRSGGERCYGGGDEAMVFGPCSASYGLRVVLVELERLAG